MIDTHCHLDFKVLAQQTDLLAQCQALGVKRMVVPGVRAAGWSGLLSMQEPNVAVALGLHPLFLAHHQEQDLTLLAQLLQTYPNVCAVGEIGLDLWHKDADLTRQSHFFEAQLHLAQTFDKPVLLHVRKAYDVVLKQLRRMKLAKAGIVHAFSGSLQQAEQYLGLGYKLGIGGAVTYPRAQKLRRLLTQLPHDSWVLETDAPDMAPVFATDKLNSPLYLPQIAQIQADIIGLEMDEWIAQTTITSQKLLGLSCCGA